MRVPAPQLTCLWLSVRPVCERVFVRHPSFTRPQLSEAAAESTSVNDIIRRLGLRPAGGNFKTIKKYLKLWDIPHVHFGERGPYPRGGRSAAPLAEVLVRDSTYNRGSLKTRLYREGIKRPICELCGQGEEWGGARMSMILDHINGDGTDNRLENLRIVCPNCNATFETHCGRNKPRGRPPVECEQCGGMFRRGHADQRFCSRACSTAHNAPLTRRAMRPPLRELLDEITRFGYVEVGRRHGVSDNAIRKWVRAHGAKPPPGPGHSLHPPPPAPRALSDTEARTALRLLAEGMSMYAVAKRLGVDDKVIGDIRHGRTYKELERPQELRDAA